jgi:hypothetical protein
MFRKLRCLLGLHVFYAKKTSSITREDDLGKMIINNYIIYKCFYCKEEEYKHSVQEVTNCLPKINEASN